MFWCDGWEGNENGGNDDDLTEKGRIGMMTLTILMIKVLRAMRRRRIIMTMIIKISERGCK